MNVVKKRLIYECRCDERLKDTVEGSTSLSYWVVWVEIIVSLVSVYWSHRRDESWSDVKET
jgi:hypothetical protein